MEVRILNRVIMIKMQKRKIVSWSKRIGLLALPVAMFACSKAQLPMQPEIKTILQVSAIDQEGGAIDSVDVYLDGELVGITPFRSENIQTGQRALRLTEEGYKVFTKQLDILEGQFYNVEAVLNPMPPTEGQLVVTVDRDSVMVKVTDANSNVVVQTRQRSSSHILVPGAYVVSGDKEGLDPVVKSVDVLPGKSTAVHLEFQEPVQDLSLEFYIQEDSVTFGEAINLRWQSNGYQVIIDQGIGLRGPKGSEKTVCPTPGLKVFTATAYGDGNQTLAKSDSVYIKPKTASPPSLTFTANPDSLVYGDPVFLEWQSDGHKVVIDQGVGLRGPVGSEEINFENPGKKVFAATAYGNDNLLTIERDSVFIKEAPMPALPVILLTTTKEVQVNAQANISWASQNAEYVVVDYVPNPGLQGNHSLTFSTPGIRIVTATAYNRAGYVSATDTIEVVEASVETVDDIVLSAESSVRADKGEAGYVDLDAASFEIKKAGRYRISAKVWYNSGDSQLNESFYLELRTSSGRVKLPRNGNAGQHFVVPDDPGSPHTRLRRSGDFELSAGIHKIDVYHYAKISESYPRFLNGEIRGPESVKILGFKIVYLD